MLERVVPGSCVLMPKCNTRKKRKGSLIRFFGRSKLNTVIGSSHKVVTTCGRRTCTGFKPRGFNSTSETTIRTVMTSVDKTLTTTGWFAVRVRGTASHISRGFGGKVTWICNGTREGYDDAFPKATNE